MVLKAGAAEEHVPCTESDLLDEDNRHLIIRFPGQTNFNHKTGFRPRSIGIKCPWLANRDRDEMYQVGVSIHANFKRRENELR